MKKRIEKLEARQQSSKYTPIVIVDSLKELDGRSDIGPDTVVIIDDIQKPLQAKQGGPGAKPE